jgi:GrpB-like predicted nucleotidyltransferase (UPF0157 family)
MWADDLKTQAIYQTVEIVPYQVKWPAEYEAERDRLLQLFSTSFSAIEPVGSTAVTGMAAKPIIDILAVVPSMDVADKVMTRLTDYGYLFSADFNVQLGDSRWLMKHENGRRTHHLHLVLPGSKHWVDKIRFRDLLRADPFWAQKYVAFKEDLAQTHSADREAYTDAKANFVRDGLASRDNHSMQPTAKSGG